MKPPLLYLLLALALSSCQTVTTTRVLPDGGTETTVSKGLSEPARDATVRIGDRLLDRWLGADVEGGGK